MKTHLRMWVLIAALLPLSMKVYSQCTVTKASVQYVSKIPYNSDSCIITFNYNFQIQSSSANHVIYIHTWLRSEYPNYFNCLLNGGGGPGVNTAPDATDLSDAFINIAINNSGNNAPEILTEYGPDPSVPLSSVGSVTRTLLPNGSAIYTLENVTDTIPVSCGTPVLTATDFWTANNANTSNVRCVSCNNEFASDYLSVVGLANCATASYTAIITNNIPCSVQSGFYRVYADVNGNGVFDLGTDVLVTDSTHYLVNCACLGGNTLTVTGSIPIANLGQDLIIVLTPDNLLNVANVTSTAVLIPSTVCAALPVTFVSFTATRSNSSNVVLKWQTSTEVNNSGFAVQRNDGNGVWNFVTFVPSQATGGNSSSLLTYTVNDANSSRGVTQYRIRQVDIDGKFKYSEVRAVRGVDQTSKTIVYPNPSNNGTVNVVFSGDQEATRNVMLVDMNGRVIKEWKNISGNSLQIQNLNSGVYSLRVLMPETGGQSVEKIIVNR